MAAGERLRKLGQPPYVPFLTLPHCEKNAGVEIPGPRCYHCEAWEKAERIRRYVSALADEASRRGPIEPASDLVKWLGWAERYADWIDPLTGPLEVAPQEFWE